MEVGGGERRKKKRDQTGLIPAVSSVNQEFSINFGNNEKGVSPTEDDNCWQNMESSPWLF